MTTSESGRAPRGRKSRAAIFQRLEAAVVELQYFGGLPTPTEAKPIWEDIWQLEAHNSTAIEGNTLVLNEVKKLLFNGRAVGGKQLKDYLEVEGYAEAADWVYSHARSTGGWGGDQLLTVTEIRYIHELALTKAWQQEPVSGATPAERPGGFREHDIQMFDGGMTPPTWPLVASKVSAWVDDVNAFGNTIAKGLAAADRVMALAALHASFERIHPFLDGNGRTGRLVLNLVLVKLGWPPFIVFKQDRSKYLRALNAADHGDPGRLAELISRSIVDNLHRLVIPSIAGPVKLVPLESLVTKEIGLAALRQAANRGRLNASRGMDGTWRSSKHAVSEYLASKYSRNGSNRA